MKKINYKPQMRTLTNLLNAVRETDTVLITNTSEWADYWQWKYEQEVKTSLSRQRLFRFFSYLCTTKKSTYSKIIHTVTRHYRQTFDEINAPTRKREVVQSRQVCMYFAAELLKLTWREIAAPFGKDHVTAIYSHKTIQNLIDTDKSFRNEINEIKQKL